MTQERQENSSLLFVTFEHESSSQRESARYEANYIPATTNICKKKKSQINPNIVAKWVEKTRKSNKL